MQEAEARREFMFHRRMNMERMERAAFVEAHARDAVDDLLEEAAEAEKAAEKAAKRIARELRKLS